MKIGVVKINLEGFLKRSLQRHPIAQDGAGSETDFIEEMLEKLYHANVRNIRNPSRDPHMKGAPCQVVLMGRRGLKGSEQGVNRTSCLSVAQDLMQKSRVVQRVEVPDECHTIPASVLWNGVMNRGIWNSTCWKRGGNHGSWGHQGTMTTIRAGHVRMRWRSWGIMSVGGKRYKDPKAY